MKPYFAISVEEAEGKKSAQTAALQLLFKSGHIFSRAKGKIHALLGKTPSHDRKTVVM